MWKICIYIWVLCYQKRIIWSNVHLIHIYAYLQITSYTGSRHTPNPCRSSCSESLKVLQLPSTLFIRRHLNGGGSDIDAGTRPNEIICIILIYITFLYSSKHIRYVIVSPFYRQNTYKSLSKKKNFKCRIRIISGYLNP